MLFLLALSIIAGQFGYIDGGSGIRFYLSELLLLIVLISEIRKSGLHLLKLLLKNKFVIAWLWFVLVGWGIGVFSGSTSDNLRSFAYIVRLGLLVIGAYCLYLSPSHRRASELLYVIPVLCMAQYIFFPDLRFLQQYGWDPHMYRAVGTIFDPPVVGSILGLLWTSLLMRLPRHMVKSSSLSIFHYQLSICFASLIFLYSRSTYISLLLVTSVYLISHRKYLYTGLFALITILSIYNAPLTIPPRMNLESAKIERMSTATSRLTEMREGIRAWSTSPLIGIGYNRVSEYKRHLNAKSTTTVSNHADSAFHSFWVTQLATTGIIGVALLLVSMWLMIRWRSELFYPLLWVSIIGVFDNVVFHPLVVISFVLLCISKRHALVS
ncbi:MAG: O-antigen ligase family protein [bacterium]